MAGKDVLPVLMFLMMCTKSEGQGVFILQRATLVVSAKNIIYCIECIKCGSLCIGETKRRLGDRIREHLRDTKFKQPQKQVSVHFNSQGHSLNDLKVQVLYQNFRDNFYRNAKEGFLIQKLGTVFPEGMNIDGGFL